jgi:VWFA-related protein
MRRAGIGVPFALCALSAASWFAVAQDATERTEPMDSGLVEQTEQRLIQLDVSLTPKKKRSGLPIPELESGDFELVVGGKPIPVVYADRICNVTREEVVAEASIESAPEAPPPPAAPRATFIFYLDHKLLTMLGQNNSFEMLERMIPELVADGDRGMVISSGHRVVQSELSDDPQDLLATLDRIRKNPAQWGEYSYAQTEEERYADIARQPSDLLARSAARAFQLEEMRITTNRLRRLGASLGGLSEIDPPKALFYFSDMTRRKPGEHFIRRFTASTWEPDGQFSEGGALNNTFAFDDVLAEANAQGVRLYTVQAQGLSMLPSRAGASGSSATGLARWRDAEDTMVGLGVETGGRMFWGGPDSTSMNRLFKRVEQDLGCFYLLSFYPGDLRMDSPLPVLLRLNEDSERARAVAESFDFRTRGQLVIQSERKREQSLILAAHVSSGAVDSNPGRGVAIPLSFQDGKFDALVQFAVRGVDLPGNVSEGCVWDLGMMHVFDPNIAGRVSGRVEAEEAASPIVLETMWRFSPGQNEIISVGREHKLGQLATVQLDLDWPDPNKSKVSLSRIAVVQQVEGVFLRKDGKKEELRRRGSLGVGAGTVDVDRPAYLIELACRGPRMKKDIWIQRRLVGESSAEFELLKWGFDGERCIQIRDRVQERQMSWGEFTYEVRVYDNPELEGEPLAAHERQFTALEQDGVEQAAIEGLPAS